MLVMTKPGKPTYYRTTPDVAAALKRVLAKLSSSKPFLARGKGATKEASINGAIMWMDSMEAEALASKLRPFIEQFEQEWAGEGGEAPAHEIKPKTPTWGETEDSKPPRRNRKGGA